VAVTLTVTDLANGNGATVVVADDGLPSGETTWFLKRAVVTAAGAGVYLTLTSGTGPAPGETISGVGYYSWKLTDAFDVTLAGPTFQTTTSEGDSVWNRCLVMVADRITAANLSGLTVYTKFWPDIDNMTFPCALVTNTGLQERFASATNLRDDVVYPVSVELGHKLDGNLESRWAQALYYRHKLERAFASSRFDERVPEVWLTESEFGPFAEPEAVRDQRMRLGLFTVQCHARVTRGL
jgi:hypothetical protein